MTTPDPVGPANSPATSSAEWTTRYQNAVMNTFGPPGRILVRGEGARVWDADGRSYIDLLGGIAVNVLGHAHPDLVAAISQQASFLHVSNFFGTPPQIALAEKLLAIAKAPGGSAVFFTNSGTEAIEAALKMAKIRGTGSRLLAFERSFHGRSTGALALTHKAIYRDPFAPLIPGVEFLPYGDTDALTQTMDDDVAAVFVEPIQGEGGVHPAPPGFLPALRDLTHKHDALLIIDEIQTGMGRTGAWLAHQRDEIGGGITPDVVTMSKALGGGVPIGATIAYGSAVAGLLGPSSHGSTFGGNPLAATAAFTTISVIERDDLMSRAETLGSKLRAACAQANPDLITEVRGVGLLLALQLAAPLGAQFVQHAYDAGFIVNAVAPDAIRLAPPLVLTDEQADAFVDFLAALDYLSLTANNTPTQEP